MARRPKAPKDMSTLFNSTTGTLAQIKSKTNSLGLLSDIVRQICPDLPEDAFNIANFVHTTLIIEVKSPVWGQRLQFERNTICNQLMIQTQGKFSHIEIKVNPQGHRQIPNQGTYQQNTLESSSIQTNSIKNRSFSEKKGSVQSMSTATAENLLKIAKNAPKGLKETLERLAANVMSNK
ncbi:DciA family protein [Colwellia sp. 1_MG-2023]|uniref:DUF721 domain-containing protein n=1 Tax=unclassified Colwellia TaxID=196834 RepID=UPI001C089BB1|nr:MULTISPECIES: DciA family protein [unclassified Colwellia]MBU2926214.1 DUF721 domain-containing protein [Colwellia sp. C2M11]MDO6652365.1 DciA family protein [Colwellia sp. 3_MG-2023]MDO6665760.1 DciA family protein [Colwellia sp. 2_MG-2023]MDO6690133.1 DciA family protein [Colwellia sp. 1_MG-2023]